MTLYGDDAERFEELREAVEEARPGGDVSNAELVRVMMDELEPSRLATN